MPKYVVISNHPPDACPSANAAVRKIGEKLPAEIPKLMQKYGIKPEVILHLDPGHKQLWVLEAPTSEAVRDMIYEGGLEKWNDFEFYMASSLEWILGQIAKQPTIF